MNKFELTPDILRQAAQCETAEEIQNKAKEFGEDITLEQAQRVFDISHSQNGAVSDEELDSVAGGCAPRRSTHRYWCKYCSTGKFYGGEELRAHISKCHPEKLAEWENSKFNHC